MKKWILKAVIQKFISVLPFSFYINYYFQKYITKGLVLSDYYFFDKLVHARHHLSFYNKYSSNQPIINSLELGTGWHPILPICMYLSGVQNIYTIDINNHLSKQAYIETIARFIELNQSGNLNNYLNYSEDKFEILEEIFQNKLTYSVFQIQSKLNIHTEIMDASKLKFESNFFQFIHSNNTFEHIYAESLAPILLELNRVKSARGIMSHFIDMTDHYSHMDTTISNFNFLKYSEKEWLWIDNSVQPMNRWRVNDFQNLYLDIKIPIIEIEKQNGDIKALTNLNLDFKYSNYKFDDLLVTHAYFIS